MSQKKLKFLFSTFILLLFQACLQDRMAPKPVEISRPQFLGFGKNDSSGLVIPLNDPVAMRFNEKMDMKTFAENFSLESISGQITGTFRYSDTSFNEVVFTPTQNMHKSEIYTISVYGGVRDINGNSKISPIEEDIPETSWFFTIGDFALNGFPYVYVSERNGFDIFRAGIFNSFLDSAKVTEASQEMRITPDGSKLLILNKLTQGILSVFNPQTFEEMAKISVGVGPEHLYVTNSKAYVSDISGQTISVINLNSLSLEITFGFTDGFRPRDIVYSEKTNKLYISSNTLNTFAPIRVVDADNYSSFYTVNNIMPSRRTQDMEISPDGEYIFLAELQTTVLVIYSTSGDSVVKTIQTDFIKTEDGVAGAKYYYLVTNGGGVYQIDYNSLSVVNALELNRTSIGVAVSAADEILYVVTPDDSTLQILESSTLSNISQVKIPGLLKNVVISKLNY